MASDVEAMRAWITGRICETRQLADEARAVAFDIEDRVLLDATVRSRRILKRSPPGWLPDWSSPRRFPSGGDGEGSGPGSTRSHSGPGLMLAVPPPVRQISPG